MWLQDRFCDRESQEIRLRQLTETPPSGSIMCQGQRAEDFIQWSVGSCRAFRGKRLTGMNKAVTSEDYADKRGSAELAIREL